MRKALLISPHFDDAVLSAGQLLSSRPNIDVITVFAGEPKEIVTTPYDEKCGFKDSKDAVAVRRLEDKEALALLKANPIHLDLTDGQYSEDNDYNKLKRDLIKIINNEDYEYIVAPLGLGHPDHIKVSDIVVDISKKIGIPIYFWEDMPLRVVEPELVYPRLKELKLTSLVHLGTGSMTDKIRALSCYRSQIGTGVLDPYVMYVPERFWRV